MSSSGHLVLFSSLLNLQQSSIVFEVLVHVGTLGAVLVVFWGEFVEMVQGFLKLIRSPSRWRELYDSDAGCRLFIWLVVGTLPAVAAALLLNDPGRTGVLQYQISGWHPDSHRPNSLSWQTVRPEGPKGGPRLLQTVSG